MVISYPGGVGGGYKESRTCPLQAGVYLDVMEDHIVMGSTGIFAD